MGSVQISDAFQSSYKSCDTYPCNLVHQTSYLGAIQAYRNRLDIASSKLFTASDGDVLIPFRDLLPNEQGEFSYHFTGPLC
jgi:hypothetical protein